MTEGQPQVARVEPGEVTPTLVTTLYTGALVSRVEAGVVALTGPGAAHRRPRTPAPRRRGNRAGHRRGAVRPPGNSPGGSGRPARRPLGSRRRGRGRPRDTGAEPHPRGLAAPRRRGGRPNHPPGSPPRPDRGRVVYKGLLHRPGDGRAAALPRPREPPDPRPVVRSRAAGRPRRWLERGHVRRSRRWPGDEPGVRAGNRRRRRGALDRSGADPAGGGARLRGTRRRP